MKPEIFFTGLASTPDTICVIDMVSGNVLEEHKIKAKRGDKIRQEYNAKKAEYIQKYNIHD